MRGEGEKGLEDVGKMKDEWWLWGVRGLKGEGGAVRGRLGWVLGSGLYLEAPNKYAEFFYSLHY